MSVPLSIEAQTLLRLLDDYEWHSYWDIHARLAASIAPGKALRRYESQEQSRSRKTGQRVRPEMSDEEKINAGQRGTATHTIHSMRRRYVEVADSAQDRMIRRRREPLPVAPRGSGRRGMNPIDGPPLEQEGENVDSDDRTDSDTPPGAMACFLDPDELRTLVTQIVTEALTDHRHRMQSWLGVRLAELERRITAVPGQINLVSPDKVIPEESHHSTGEPVRRPVSLDRDMNLA